MTVVEDHNKMNDLRDKFPVGMEVLAVDGDRTCLKIFETLLQRCRYNASLREKEALWRDITTRKMEQRHGSIPFNPFPHFTLTRVLSLVAPHLYTKEELAQVEEIHQTFIQESPFSFISQKNTMEEETVNNKKRRCTSDDGSTSNYDMEKTRVKPKKNNKKPKKGEPMPMPTPSPSPPPPPPDLPIHARIMITALNGTDVKFLMCKKLFDTDLNPNNNRLSMPRKEINCDFLTEIEKEVLDSKEDDRPIGLEVIVLDPSFREFTMSFKKWEMRTTSVYNLVKNWKRLLSQNTLRKGCELYIWSFRVNDKLYFLLNNKDS